MDNRSLLLQRSLELFASRGYDAVGVQEIVEAAGITKPTLYHYFGSKHGLLQALLEQHYADFHQVLDRAAHYQGDLTNSLTGITKAYFNFARQHRTYYRMQLALWFAPQESEAFQAVAGLSKHQYQVLETMFQQAVHDHGNMQGRHKAYAASLIGVINAYIGLWLNGAVDLNDDLVYRLVHQFEHGIYS